MEYTLEEKYSLIKDLLLKQKETDPLLIITRIMCEPFINIHGPEHHFLDGASFMAAIYNNRTDFNLSDYLDKLAQRTIKMPGAICGYWGICGSVASIGAALAILDETGPLSNDENYSRHMIYTSSVIKKMSQIGGPRCCKRNAFISISEGIKFLNEYYGFNIEHKNISCEFSNLNAQCIKERCPFYKK